MTEGLIIKGVSGQYTVLTSEGQITCNARGLFRKQKFTPLAGDIVQIKQGEAGTGTLMHILPRKNEVKRPRVANVDVVVMFFSAKTPDISYTMLDRYLMQAEYEGIEAAVCINKIDLSRDISKEAEEIYSGAGYPVFLVSAKCGFGLDKFANFLKAKTSVLAGPSGSGKSSIINKLVNKDLPTGEISERIGRGKHTTRHTEFIPLDFKGYIIDTPGFSSLEPPDVPLTERAALFREFREWLGECRFGDCLHKSESDCAIKEQVGITISKQRYNRYLEWLDM